MTCTVEGCTARLFVPGWCGPHYLAQDTPPAPATCSVEGCVKAPWGRGWCNVHYSRWRRTGSPLGRSARPEIVKRAPKRTHLDGLCRVDGCPDEARRMGRCWGHAESIGVES